jgi:hypothetical protein
MIISIFWLKTEASPSFGIYVPNHQTTWHRKLEDRRMNYKVLPLLILMYRRISFSKRLGYITQYNVCLQVQRLNFDT